MYKIIILIVAILPGSLVGQNIESIRQAKPVVLNGSISAGFSYLNDERLTNLESNFGYQLRMKINLRLYSSFSLPFSLTYSDQQTNFNRPTFSRFGLSPSYKWITVHGGYRSYKLSPYMLAGNTVLGAGIDLKPGNFRISIFSGNLSHNLNIGYNNKQYINADLDYYKRKIYGGKIGYEKNNTHFLISIMKAKEDPFSGNYLTLDSLSINPKENLAIGMHIGIEPVKGLTLKTNVVGSALSEDIKAPEVEVDDAFKEISEIFMPINESTRAFYAYDVEVGLNFSRTYIGAKYEYIDPNYATLGLVHLQTDLQNLTFNINSLLFKSRFSLNARIGIQRDNVKDFFEKSENRLIVNGGLQYTVNENLNFGINYNNFTSDGGVSVGDFRDSLVLSTNNSGWNTHATYLFGSEKNQSISINASRNQFSIEQGSTVLNDNTSATYSLAYMNSSKSNGCRWGTTLQVSSFYTPGSSSVERYGLSANLGKTIKKNLMLRFAPNFSWNITDGKQDGNVYGLKVKLRQKINKKNTLAASGHYRKRNTQKLESFDQYRFALNYNLRF